MRVGLALILSTVLACAAEEESDPDVPGTDAAQDTGDAPSSPDAMFSYLTGGEYLGYEAESSVHVSAGPHGSGGVRTYINPALAASLAAGDREHPVGAAAIKELYASDGETVSGWAAMVKTEAGGGGSAWYFYEVFSTSDGSDPIDGAGLSICTGCHSAGVDFIRVGYPLQ